MYLICAPEGVREEGKLFFIHFDSFSAWVYQIYGNGYNTLTRFIVCEDQSSLLNDMMTFYYKWFWINIEIFDWFNLFKINVAKWIEIVQNLVLQVIHCNLILDVSARKRAWLLFVIFIFSKIIAQELSLYI